MNIRECTTDKDIKATYAVIRQLYSLPEKKYLAFVREMMETDYRMIAVWEKTKPVAVAGFRVGRRLYCGKYLHIDNLIIDEKHRGKGFARGLVQWLEKEAKKLDCDTVLADTYVDNTPAHRLFIGAGFHIRGYHLKKNCKDEYKTTFVSDKPKERGC